MNLIDVFYQGERLGEIRHLEVGSDATFGVLMARIAEKHGLTADVVIFIEDKDEPIGGDVPLKEHASPTRLKVHVHRVREVKVTVTFNGKTVERLFGPGTTVGRVKRWAAVREFRMTVDEAGEHALQIRGTYERPALGTHIGDLDRG